MVFFKLFGLMCSVPGIGKRVPIGDADEMLYPGNFGRYKKVPLKVLKLTKKLIF